MVKDKIKVRRIDSVTARTVTFSKRRQGLLKKAAELSVLCDAEISVIIFSATGKLYEFSSSSMEKVLERHMLHQNNLPKLDPPSLELQLEHTSSMRLNKELADMSLQFRRMRGENLEGLGIEELHKLEKLLEKGHDRICSAKEELVMTEISNLEKRGEQLIEENKMLKEKVIMSSIGKSSWARNTPNDEGQEEGSSNSAVVADDCGSDTSLKLGY